MGPKKQAKKEVVEQPPKPTQVEPQIPAHQLQGYGKFEYLSGAIYEGNWRLVKGVKVKHGLGVLTIPGTSTSNLGKQTYDGNWQHDEMTDYGVYNYADGAIYRGEWLHNKHHGHGQYQFANGTLYEGEWSQHQMHGTGMFIDHNGKVWKGEYRQGKFDCRRQKELIKEKAIVLQKIAIKKEVQGILGIMMEAIAKSDKKTLKDNFGVYFPVGDVLKEFVKEPYAKLDERTAEKWAQVIKLCKNTQIKMLDNAAHATFLGKQRIVSRQLQGVGQIVQMSHITDDRITKMALVCYNDANWAIVSVQDDQKKK